MPSGSAIAGLLLGGILGASQDIHNLLQVPINKSGKRYLGPLAQWTDEFDVILYVTFGILWVITKSDFFGYALFGVLISNIALDLKAMGH